jgi:hypothetical protein
VNGISTCCPAKKCGRGRAILALVSLAGRIRRSAARRGLRVRRGITERITGATSFFKRDSYTACPFPKAAHEVPRLGEDSRDAKSGLPYLVRPMSRGGKRPCEKEKCEKEGRYVEAARKDHAVLLSRRPGPAATTAAGLPPSNTRCSKGRTIDPSEGTGYGPKGSSGGEARSFRFKAQSV